MDEAERLRQFLLEIHMNEGKVCEDFETCHHKACNSSVMAFMYADAALRGLTLADFRKEQVKSFLEKQLGAIGIRCHKCGACGVVRAPTADEHPQCRGCSSNNVEPIPVERTAEGFINNCALSAGYLEEQCQMCLGQCPEKYKFNKLGRRI